MALASLATGLAACQPAGLAASPTASLASASPSASPTARATATPTPASSPSATPTGQPTPQPPVAGAPFACDPLDIRNTADQTHTLIADVRVGTHAGYDRVVVQFGPPFAGALDGLPEYIVEVTNPPLTQDPSGQPMAVPGSHFLQIALLGATKYDENFNLRYAGPTRFDPDFPALAALYERGDFEATSTWYVGLKREPCLRVFTLANPMRLVVDIAH